VPHTPLSVPDFAKWPSFPFEGALRVKQLDDPVDVEPPRKGEGSAECLSCNAPDDAYIWVSERWRVRAMDRPTGLPMVLILESRSHLDLGDLPNLLAAELGVMTVRLERAIRSLDGVARVHVNRWGDGAAHLHMWFLARPYGRLQLRGTFLSLWDAILPAIPESTWRENLAHVAAWLAEFGGRPLAAPPRIQWQAPSNLRQQAAAIQRSDGATPDGATWDEDAPNEAISDDEDAPNEAISDDEDAPNEAISDNSATGGSVTDGSSVAFAEAPSDETDQTGDRAAG
jgi:diadenosine tetraphosphate (Ap4A) HIT family hydrolase